MPLIRLETNERLAPEVKAGLCGKLSQLIVEGIGKPEGYVMAVVHDDVAMIHAGAKGPPLLSTSAASVGSQRR